MRQPMLRAKSYRARTWPVLLGSQRKFCATPWRFAAVARCAVVGVGPLEVRKDLEDKDLTRARSVALGRRLFVKGVITASGVEHKADQHSSWCPVIEPWCATLYS